MTDNELLKAIYKDTQDLKKRIDSIEMTLENETNRNIKIIAEVMPMKNGFSFSDLM